MFLNTGRLSERAHELERYPQNFAIPTPRFAKKFFKVSEMHFDKFPDHSAFQCWKTSVKTEVCSCSSFPTDAMLWIKEVEMVESVDDLKTSQFIGGHGFPNCEMLDCEDRGIEEDHQERLLREESQPGGAKGTNARPISLWKTDC